MINRIRFKKTVFLFAFFLAIIQSGHSVPKNNQQEQEPENTRYLNKIFEEVDIKKDLNFAQSVNEKGELENLKLDVYAPKGDDTMNRPVILWIHGGGFRHGNDKSQSYIVSMAKRFAMKGYVGVSIDYRLRERPKDDMEKTIYDSVEDAGKALVWIRENAEMLKIDPSKIIVAGGSAGGMIGAYLTLNDNDHIPGVDKSGVIAFVNLWGSPSPSWGELHIDSNDPPTIIVHGMEDKTVAFSNSENLKAQLDKNNVVNELVPIPEAGHTPMRHLNDFEKNIDRFLFNLSEIN